MTVKVTGELLTGSVADLAMFLGLTERRVQQLEKSRVILRIARGSYDLARSVQAYCNFLRGVEGGAEDKKSESAERARLVGVKADLSAMDLAERRGDLISAAGVRKQDFTLARILRNNLQSMPDRISALVASESDPAVCHRLILSEVNALLESVIESMKLEQVDEGELDIARKQAADELESSGALLVSQETSG